MIRPWHFVNYKAEGDGMYIAYCSPRCCPFSWQIPIRTFSSFSLRPWSSARRPTNNNGYKPLVLLCVQCYAQTHLLYKFVVSYTLKLEMFGKWATNSKERLYAKFAAQLHRRWILKTSMDAQPPSPFAFFPRLLFLLLSFIPIPSRPRLRGLIWRNI